MINSIINQYLKKHLRKVKVTNSPKEALNGSSHAVRTFGKPAAFLSFEHWKTKKPDSVVLNWEGAPDGEVHKKLWENN